MAEDPDLAAAATPEALPEEAGDTTAGATLLAETREVEALAAEPPEATVVETAEMSPRAEAGPRLQAAAAPDHLQATPPAQSLLMTEEPASPSHLAARRVKIATKRATQRTAKTDSRPLAAPQRKRLTPTRPRLSLRPLPSDQAGRTAGFSLLPELTNQSSRVFFVV